MQQTGNRKKKLWIVVEGNDNALVRTDGLLEYSAEQPEGIVSSSYLDTIDNIDYYAAYLEFSSHNISIGFRDYDIKDVMGRRLFGKALAFKGYLSSTKYSQISGERCEIQEGQHFVTTTSGEVQFPRIDPAVIVLVRDEADEHVLMANNLQWNQDKYSLIAGFVEIGESLEDTAIREVDEEVGVSIKKLEYFGSDIWPFPRSLMVGFTATAVSEGPLHLQKEEIRNAKWIPKKFVRALLNGNSDSGFELPPRSSITTRMLENWVQK